MRVVVTGPLNEHGRAIVDALAKAGHTVRAFGVPAGEDPFHNPSVECFPGVPAVSGSLEPVAVECQAIVHAANLDAPGKDAKAFAAHVEKGTLYARYAAERELVSQFVALVPASPGRAAASSVAQARAHVGGTKALVPHTLIEASDPASSAKQVLAILGKGLAAPLGSAEKPAPVMPGAPTGR